ncbi:hypothetical protein BP6252_03585 [Coleophoma cylindrospora]|uniref:Zn(2)-C6 fungal-type domain-containing protein n=1 Tax=Coleophoma cylindrospora TaxID=1849047 RepID=A0A3D8S833_9HELO|nr:hypothetical protein BP6252_03585 [Coleophoma cylindrospora]
MSSWDAGESPLDPPGLSRFVVATSSDELRRISQMDQATRGAGRSRAGCWTCRDKKVKCDEQRPQCQRCTRLSRVCDYSSRPRKRRGKEREKKKSHGLAEDSHSPALETDGGLKSPPGSENPMHLKDALEQADSVENSLDIQQRLQRLGDYTSIRAAQRPIDVLQFSILRYLQPPTLVAPCSLELSYEDHSAIHHFRTTFSTYYHTKNPQYSVLSIIFRLAQNSPMLMHMVLSLAGREEMFYKSGGEEAGKEVEASLDHYNQAVNMMTKAVEGNADEMDMAVVLAALWLMILYEQKFGDSDGRGLAQHLKGTASILRQKCRSLANMPTRSQALVTTRNSDDSVTEAVPSDEENKVSTFFIARMIVWISALDAGAASYGIGGHVNSSVVELSKSYADLERELPLDWSSAIHQYSRPLFRSMWGKEYPSSEILDDLQNQEVYHLLGECCQLRYMVARLAALYPKDGTLARDRTLSVSRALDQVGQCFAELIDTSKYLKCQDRPGERLVSNILTIVPHYHAVVLDFFRLTRPGQPLNHKQDAALKGITTLAFQAYQNEGDRAMFRIAWPLFIAGIETDDLVHREWILTRFRSLGRYGKNYRRAFKLLHAVIAQSEELGRSVDVLQLIEEGSYERFAI